LAQDLLWYWRTQVKPGVDRMITALF